VLILHDLYVSVRKTGVDAEEFFIAVVQLPCGFHTYTTVRVSVEISDSLKRYISENFVYYVTLLMKENT